MPYAAKNESERKASGVRRTQRWRARHPKRAFASRMWNRYRLTLEDRLALFESSDGLCALCYEYPATQIDHDHETGRVRGAICAWCNRGLAFYEKQGGEAVLHYLSSDWRESAVTPS